MNNELNDFAHELQYEGNRVAIRELNRRIIEQVRPEEVDLSLFIIDPLIEKATRGEIVQVGDEMEFGLGGDEVLAIVVVPILVNWLSDILKEVALKGYREVQRYLEQSSANMQLSEAAIDRLAKDARIRLKRKEKEILVQVINSVVAEFCSQLGQSLAARKRIFLSYARSDQDRVESLYTQLLREGFIPWMESEDILPGAVIATAMQQAIRDADYFVACLSTSLFQEAGNAWKNLHMALDVLQELPEGHIFVIPARLEHCEVPQKLAQLQHVDLFEPNGFTRLTLAMVSKHVQKVGANSWE